MYIKNRKTIKKSRWKTKTIKKSRWLQILLTILGIVLLFILFIHIDETCYVVDIINKLEEQLNNCSNLAQSIISEIETEKKLLQLNLFMDILCLLVEFLSAIISFGLSIFIDNMQNKIDQHKN